MPEPNAPADFVLLPNAVCAHPPMRHRHTSYWARHLSPFALYLLGGILIEARAALTTARHNEALAAGRVAIGKEVRTGRKYFARRENAKQGGYRAPPKGAAITRAGVAAYKQALRALRRTAPDEVTLDVSKRHLLRVAGLAIKTKNYRAIEPALNRLCRPVGAGGCDMPALLRDWEPLPGGKLRLRVDGAWLPANRFKRVLWPPPKRSPAALALHLFVASLDTRPTNKREVTASWLAERLGLDPEAGTGARNRAISAALDGVNALLRDVADDVVAQAWERKPKVNIPLAYGIEPLTAGKIRMVAEPRPKVYEAALADARPHGRKVPIKRVKSRRAGVDVLASNEPKSVALLASDDAKRWPSSHRGVDVFASDRPVPARETIGPQGFRRGWRGSI